ncbi:MAG TPA: hypothetical protein VJ719_01900 [Chthoniobacterales bacterium]|nr:hypothetical protein [Chthoniobacterales bacterium]
MSQRSLDLTALSSQVAQSTRSFIWKDIEGPDWAPDKSRCRLSHKVMGRSVPGEAAEMIGLNQYFLFGSGRSPTGHGHGD